MFDKYYPLSASHYHSHNSTVVEKRAPTDESVKLLKEMEDAARQKIISSIALSDNSFECKIHKSVDMLSCNTKYHVVYKLNGRTQTAVATIEEHKNHSDTEIALIIRDKLAESIANEMLETLFRTMGSF